MTMMAVISMVEVAKERSQDGKKDAKGELRPGKEGRKTMVKTKGR
jgi:hypothetical protein